MKTLYFIKYRKSTSYNNNIDTIVQEYNNAELIEFCSDKEIISIQKL